MWLSIRNAIGLHVMKKLGVNRPLALVWGVSTLAALATLLLHSFSANAEGRARQDRPIDVVLLLDTSGSMIKTDPMRLRYQGAKQITQFLTNGDRLAIVGFSGKTQLVQALKPYTADQRPVIEKEIENIKTEGQYTDLLEAVKIGREILESQPRAEAGRVMLLLSDGKMEPDPAQGMPFARTLELIHDVLPGIKAKEIAIYTLAFSDQADRALLGEIAGATDAIGLYAATPADLNKTFAELFTAMKPEPAVSRPGKELHIDDGIEEATFYISHTPNASITLTSPKGERLNGANVAEHVSWFATEKFDIITVKEPESGDWEINGVESAEHFTAVMTNLKLAIDWPILVRSQNATLIQARLYEGERPVVLPEMSSVNKYAFQIIPTDSVSAPILEGVLNDEGNEGDLIARDGIFSKMIYIQDPGEYRMTVSAKAPTFYRTQPLPFKVKPPLITFEVLSGDDRAGHKSKHMQSGNAGEHTQSGHSEGVKESEKDSIINGDEHWAFRAKVSKEATSFRELSVILIARSEGRRRYEIPLKRSIGDALEYEVQADALPLDGSYSLQAVLKGTTKNRQEVEEETDEISFKRTTVRRYGEAPVNVVVREVQPASKEPEFPIIPIGIITVANLLIGIITYRILKKRSALRLNAAAKYIPQKSLVDAIVDLEGRVSKSEVGIDDPIFEPVVTKNKSTTAENRERSTGKGALP